ncbi:MAG: response regulator [Acidimicrobiia bacterium]|nr:MAG: response regulator [Acidimicrobiia bacterium]
MEQIYAYRDLNHKGGSHVHRVLVVDDSHVIRRLVEVCLSQLQLDVEAVGTGRDACALMLSDVPDMLLLDVGLPDMSGWDVLEFARSQPALDGMVVIVLTGRSDISDVERADEAGADRYLIKPFRPAELRRVVLDTLHGAPTPTP